ncbi:PQQ-binding-like beta-propeller repeat protein [Streptomyces daliensis]
MRRRTITGCLLAALALLGTAPALATAPARPTGPEPLAGEPTLTADPMPTWQTDGIVWSMAYAKGVVYVGGVFGNVSPPGSAPGENRTPRTNFAAFDAVTGELLPCAPSFTGGSGSVRALETSADGEVLYVGGSFGTVTSGERETGVSNAVAFDTADCSLRADFRPGVAATVRAIEPSGDTVYLGGDFGEVDGETRDRIAAVTTSGTLLPFRASIDEPVRAIEAAPEFGKVLVGGDFFTVNRRRSHALVSLDATSGATQQNFSWLESSSVVKDLARDGQNFYLAAEGTGGFDGRIAGVLATGQRKWTDTCLGATQAVVPYEGVLYSGSHAHDCGGTPGGFPEINARQHLLGQSLSDRTILPWFPDTNGGIGEKVGPRVLVMAGDILWVGGEFTAVNDKPQQALTRMPASPDTVAPQVPAFSGTSTSSGRITLSWKAAWDRDDGTLTYRVYRDGAYYTSLTRDSRFWDRPDMTWTDTVEPGSTHRYALEVTDGENLSGRNGPVYVTAR